MEKEKKIPALFNEKDLSADFFEYVADNGDIVWNKSHYMSEFKWGLFFFDNKAAEVKYSTKSNYLDISFANDSARNKCLQMFWDEFEPALAEQGVEMVLENTSSLELYLTFWWK